MKLVLSVNGVELHAVLHNNPSAEDLKSMLPLQLSMEDYVAKEKIGYLPRKLITNGSGPFEGEAIGDIAYYAPWGNIAIFYKAYRYSQGLIRLGRIESPIEPLLIDGPFSITIKPL